MTSTTATKIVAKMELFFFFIRAHICHVDLEYFESFILLTFNGRWLLTFTTPEELPMRWRPLAAPLTRFLKKTTRKPFHTLQILRVPGITNVRTGISSKSSTEHCPLYRR